MKISDYPQINLTGTQPGNNPISIFKDYDRRQEKMPGKRGPIPFNYAIFHRDITTLYISKPVSDPPPFFATLRIGNKPIVLSNPIEEIAIRLHVHIQQQKCFLKLGYSLRHLSEETGVQLYILSAYINQMAHCRFNDYLNKFRVSYCMELIENGQAEQYTLEALASKCGFSNRNTFTSAFKKFMGKTPSSFLKTKDNPQPVVY